MKQVKQGNVSSRKAMAKVIGGGSIEVEGPAPFQCSFELDAFDPIVALP